MTTTPALILLLATVVAGIAAGLLHLQRSRRKWLVTTHLVLALAGLALVAQLALTLPGPRGLLPLAMLAIAVAAGWGASRIGRRGGRLMLAGHAVLGVAGFLVFLAWVRNL